MKITVVVPTYCRSTDLARCLQGFKQQIRSADEVIVVVRDTDQETWKFLETCDTGSLPLKTVTVTLSGVIAAMNQGLDAAQGDVICFTDDDAVPHPDWIQRIENHFLEDAQVGGVGGRDVIQRKDPWFLGAQETVGHLQWHGRMIGNHHIGIGQAREVDILKGVNMSFRRTAIGDLHFDRRLLGSGAQVHFEVLFCLAIKHNGWKLVYDPAVLVDHYLAQRFDEDQRNHFDAVAFFNEVHNETLAVLENLSLLQRCIFVIWVTLVGTRRSFGLVQCLRYLPSEGKFAWRKWMASIRGRWQGWVTWRQSVRELTFAPTVSAETVNK